MLQVEEHLVWHRDVVNAELIMKLLLPPLVFESAFKMSYHAFMSSASFIAVVTTASYLFTMGAQGAFAYYFTMGQGVDVVQVTRAHSP